jgi:hypothetical protein
MFGAQAFCSDLAAASFDYPRSVGGIAVVAASPLVMLGAQTFTERLGSASFDAILTALRDAQAVAGDDVARLRLRVEVSWFPRHNHIRKANTRLQAYRGGVIVLAQRDGRTLALPDQAIRSSRSHLGFSIEVSQRVTQNTGMLTLFATN